MLLFFASIVHGQRYHTIPFGSLGVDDRMDSAGLEQFKHGNYDMILPDGTYRKGPVDANVNEGLVLITEENDMYLVHVVYFGAARNWSPGPVVRSADGRYFVLTTNGIDHGEGFTNSHEEIWIIDPRSARMATITTNASRFEFAPEEEMEGGTDNGTSRSTEVLLDGRELTLLSSCTHTSEAVACADPGGAYAITDSTIIRTKDYDPVRKCMVPVRSAGPIAAGMSLADVQAVHADIDMQEAAPANYGLDMERGAVGYEIRSGDHLMCYVRMREGAQSDRIKDIVAISPTYIIGGVQTGNSCAELLARYPKLVLRVDPFNGWEVADVDEPAIRITFKTTEKDRVGRYAADQATGHSVFQGMARPAAPIDLITVFTP